MGWLTPSRLDISGRTTGRPVSSTARRTVGATAMAAASSSARWEESRRDSGIAQWQTSAPTTASPSRTGTAQSVAPDSHVTTVCPSSAARRAAAVRSSWPRRASTIVPGVDTPATSTALLCNRPCSNWQTAGNAARGSSCAWHTRRTATRSSSMGAFSTSEGAGQADTSGLPGDERTGVGATRDARHLACNLQSIGLARGGQRQGEPRARPDQPRDVGPRQRPQPSHGRFGQRDAPADQPLGRQEQLVVVIERDSCLRRTGPPRGVTDVRASTAPLTTSIRSCAIAASLGLPAMASCTSAMAPGMSPRFEPCPDTRKRHARIECRAFAGGNLHRVRPARLPAQARDQQCDQPRRWRRIEQARSADGRVQEVLGVDERRLANPLLCQIRGALDQAGRVCGRRQPASLTPPVPRLSQVASCRGQP